MNSGKAFSRTKISFRPTFWSTIFALFGFVLLLALGTWQINRLEWKNALVAERKAGSVGAPVELSFGTKKIQSLLWKRTQIRGFFIHKYEIYLAARSMRGNFGFHVLTPLRHRTGKTVLINRGWVPREKLDPSSRTLGQIKGEVSIEGIITPGFRKGIFTPANDAENNVWLYVDYAAMSRFAGEDLVEVVVDAVNDAPGGFPLGGQTRIELPNDHLQYALTWYALGLTLACIWFFWNLNRSRELEAQPRDNH